jgi:membrane glycosyltransferase
VVEIVLSALVAPLFMLAHVGALFNLALGRDSGWGAQGREGGRLPLGRAMLEFGHYSIVGLSLLAYCYIVSPVLIGWLSLIYAGLIIAPVLAWLMGLNSNKLFFDWLMIPEERKPLPVLVKYDVIHNRMQGLMTGSDEVLSAANLAVENQGPISETREKSPPQKEAGLTLRPA